MSQLTERQRLKFIRAQLREMGRKAQLDLDQLRGMATRATCMSCHCPRCLRRNAPLNGKEEPCASA